MRIPRFYFPETIATGNTHKIQGSYRHRLVNVLRLQQGDDLILFNGNDQTEYICKLVSTQKKFAEVEILDSFISNTESSLNLCLWQAVSRSDRMDYAIQKAVELGAKTIQPVTTERSPYKLQNEKLEKKLNHWQNIIVHACEQSGRNNLPTLYKPELLQQLLTGNLAPVANKWLLSPRAQQQLTDMQPDTQKPITILIGAEGGFTDNEEASCIEAGFISVSAGPRILRTETAATAILAWAQMKFGDMGSPASRF